MSISLMTDVWKLKLQAPRKMVLLALADNANDEGTDCWPSVGKLVEKCSMSERAIQGHLAALEESGYIKRHERLGRSNKFTIYVDQIRSELMHKPRSNSPTPAKSAPPISGPDLPPQILHPSTANPHSTDTPADSAPPQDLHPTPADSAPITTREPSLRTTTTCSNAIESCGGDSFSEELYYPVCTQEESIAIAKLIASCPSDFRQKALDEIEGARQAGVIKTSLVPFSRAIVTAIRKGTFTVGHGVSIINQRSKMGNRESVNKQINLVMNEETIKKGKAILDRVK